MSLEATALTFQPSFLFFSRWLAKNSSRRFGESIHSSATLLGPPVLFLVIKQLGQSNGSNPNVEVLKFKLNIKKVI